MQVLSGFWYLNSFFFTAQVYYYCQLIGQRHLNCIVSQTMLDFSSFSPLVPLLTASI